jgi:predicted transcriptional regulator
MVEGKMKITKTQLKQIIKEELENISSDKEEVTEGLENITPENLQLALDALLKIATQPEVAYAAIAAAVGVTTGTLRNMLKSSDEQGEIGQ